MEQEKLYLDFLKEKGRSLSEMNPGSLEIALSLKDSLIALDMLKRCKMRVYGGDVLSEKNGKLFYAYQIWGNEYQYLNWSCDKELMESDDDFIFRSYEIAKKYIVAASEVADKLSRNCYFVLVT